jgi:hypothetical protein
MEKKDLKSKMFVKLRDGEIYLVVEDVLVKYRGFMLISYYSEDLLNIDDVRYDIVEVFKIHNPYFNFKDNLGMLGVSFDNIDLHDSFVSLWKREEVLNDEQIV